MRRKPNKQAVVPDELIDALEAVLAYSWHDEFQDYHHCRDHGMSNLEKHIFLQLEVIRHWLDHLEEHGGRG